jgi:hypothetical protein
MSTAVFGAKPLPETDMIEPGGPEVGVMVMDGGASCARHAATCANASITVDAMELPWSD